MVDEMIYGCYGFDQGLHVTREENNISDIINDFGLLENSHGLTEQSDWSSQLRILIG